MSNITLNDNQLSSLPSLQTNFTNTELTNSYPSIKIISIESFHPKCVICLQIPEDPVSLCNKVNLILDERHLFCRKCTTDYNDSKCPLCNEALTEDAEFIEDKQARRTINDMKYNVICICPKDCGSVLSLNKLETHLELCCGKQVLTDRTLSPEINACAVIKCSQCKTQLAKEDQQNLTNHKKQCPERFVECKSKKDSIFPSLLVRNRLQYRTEDIEKMRCAGSFEHSELTSNCSEQLLFMPIYDLSPSDNNAEEHKFISSTVSISINTQNLLFIETPEDYRFYDKVDSERYHRCNVNEVEVPSRFRLSDEEVEVPSRFRLSDEEVEVPSCYEDEGFFYIRAYNLKYKISIYAYLSSEESVLVCQQAFTYSEIKTLNSMYSHKKIDTPQSFIDFKEFFTDKGLSNMYVDKIGASIIWRIVLSEHET